MTICISLLCENDEVALIGADRMVTDRGLPIEFETSDSKYEQYRSEQVEFAISSAGVALPPSTIHRAVSSSVDEIETLLQAVKLVKKTYINIKQKKFEEEFLEQRGISFEEFYDSGMHNSGRGETWDKFYSDFELNLDIIVSGLDQRGANTYRVSDGGAFDGLTESFESIGFDAIGSGSNLARDTLTSRYSRDLSVEEGLYVLYAALQNSSQAPGVGSEFDITVIDSSGPREIQAEEIATLNKAFYDMEEANPYPEAIGEQLDI